MRRVYETQATFLLMLRSKSNGSWPLQGLRARRRSVTLYAILLASLGRPYPIHKSQTTHKTRLSPTISSYKLSLPLDFEVRDYIFWAHQFLHQDWQFVTMQNKNYYTITKKSFTTSNGKWGHVIDLQCMFNLTESSFCVFFSIVFCAEHLSIFLSSLTVGLRRRIEEVIL